MLNQRLQLWGYAMTLEEGVLLFAFVAIALYLLTQRWFWVVAFGLGSLACAFSTVASVINFQILLAIVFLFLTLLLWGLTVAVIERAT